ncbi:PLDc N-terminal domain-containing protein [Rhodococcus sp. X156]|uniref:PLDc N-terminal domain-containing protein n=1 Tax=Rhodococcus sp. X156 TaxID=2499145 RepID=UPI000FD97DEC
MSFWEVFWYIVIVFGFIAYLVILFSIFADLFSDHETSGGAKAAWVVFLLLFPVLTSLVYLVVRGDGMAQRSRRSMQAEQQREAAYIRQVAGTSPAEQIETARRLLDADVISREEFDSLKAHALAGVRTGAGSSDAPQAPATDGAGATTDTAAGPTVSAR